MSQSEQHWTTKIESTVVRNKAGLPVLCIITSLSQCQIRDRKSARA